MRPPLTGHSADAAWVLRRASCLRDRGRDSQGPPAFVRALGQVSAASAKVQYSLRAPLDRRPRREGARPVEVQAASPPQLSRGGPDGGLVGWPSGHLAHTTKEADDGGMLPVC